MKEREVKETKEVNEVREESGEVAAFFDLDGTLMGLPSLEKRFFSMLRYRKLIGMRSYISWLMETVRLLPLGLNHVMHANKMYLRGVSVHEGASLDVPLFNAEAIERAAWHAERGHLLVMVSGTLEMLAAWAARELEAALGERGLTCTIRVCATRLEQKDERWTGRIVGKAMFGETKALAIRRVAAEEDLDLRRCFAYGDSSSDLWMLESAGKPAAVNPSNDLVRIARRNHWPVLRWGEQKNFAQRTRRAQSAQRSEESDERLAAGHAKSGYGT